MFLISILLFINLFHCIFPKTFGNLQDILVNSGLVASGSIDGVLSGKKYNRAVRAWKMLMEALERLRFELFVQDNSHVPASFGALLDSMVGAFPDGQFMDFIESPQIEDLLAQYSAYVKESSENNPMFSYWSSFIEMVQLLLLFLRGTRADNWHLHLSAIRSMLPWFFAYDRVNYQRYLTAYWLEMNLLEYTHPGYYY